MSVFTLKQILMTALAIPVKTVELARTLLMDTSVAVQQVLLEQTVKKVSLINNRLINDHLE